MNQDVLQEIEALQDLIQEQVPEARFRLEPPEEEKDPWSLYIYTPSGNMQMPGNIMGGLDNIWRTHRITVLAVIYPLSLYEER